MGVDAGRPRPHLVPHSLPAKRGNICRLRSLRGPELPAAHAAGFWAHTDLWGTEPPGGSQDRGSRTCSSNLPLGMGREGGSSPSPAGRLTSLFQTCPFPPSPEASTCQCRKAKRPSSAHSSGPGSDAASSRKPPYLLPSECCPRPLTLGFTLRFSWGSA